MEEEDFWGHSVKKNDPTGHEISKIGEINKISTDRNSIEEEKRDKNDIFISSEDLVNVEQLEATQGLISASREARNASRASARKHSENVESDHHTRSPSYTSEEESEKEEDRKKRSVTDHSAEESEAERSSRVSEDRNDDAYSEQFDSSVAESEAESETENTKIDNIRTTIADRLKPALAEKAADSVQEKEKSLPKKVAKPKTQIPKKSPYAQKSTKPKRVAEAAKTISTTKSRPPAIAGTKNSSVTTVSNGGSDQPRRFGIRSASLRDEIEYLKKQLSESKTENRTLRQLQRRQEAAFVRLDTHRAAIPTLLDRQAEEARVMKEQLRMQKEKQRELEKVLRERDDRLMHALDKIKRLDKALKDKGIDYRAHAPNSDPVKINQALDEKEKKIHDLERQALLLTKNHKHQLNIEVMRHKETQRKLRELEEVYKKRKSDKPKGYQTTRTARRAPDDKVVGVGLDRLAHSLNAGHVETMKSVLAERQESTDDDILAQTRTVMALLKTGPEAKPAGNRSSKARNSRRATKTKSENTDSDEELRNGAAGARAAGLEKHKIESEAFAVADTARKPEKTLDSGNSGDRAGAKFETGMPSAESPALSKDSLRKSPFFDERNRAEPKSSILDEILQSKPIQKTPPPPEKPSSSPKSNVDFLDDLFGPRNSISEKKADSTEKTSGADSGFVNSVDSTPKQVQSAKSRSHDKMKSQTIDLEDDLFSPRKPNGPKAASNGLFPWEMEAVEKSQTAQKTNSKTDDLFSNVLNSVI